MSHVLVLIPVKPNLHPRLKARCEAMAARLPAANPVHRISIVQDDSGPGDRGITTLAERASHLAEIRQAMVERHLRDHDYVFWIDADIVAYAAALPSVLVKRCPAGIAAPLVLLKTRQRHFYDTAGFVEAGCRARCLPPYFDQPGPVFDLDSVGCIYMVPANAYRNGARHESTPGHTEHYSLCRQAKQMGLPVRAFGDLAAYHADLARIGEGWH